MIHDQLLLTRPDRAQAKDRTLDAGLPEIETLFGYSDAEPINAFVLQLLGAPQGSMPVSVGLDHCHDADTFPDHRFHGRKITRQGVQIYLGSGGARMFDNLHSARAIVKKGDVNSTNRRVTNTSRST